MIHASVDRWRSAIPRLYQRPTLFADRGLTGDLIERIGFDSLQSRLLEASGGGTPLTWLVRGGPATGKSSLCAALAVALSKVGSTCVLIDHHIMGAHGVASTNGEALLRELRPAAFAEKKWNSDIKHGRIVVFVDGLNEIKLRHGQGPTWKVAEQLVFGNHRCPVVATTRSAGEFDGWSALRAVEPLELPPFAAEQIDAFLADNDLDVGSARAAIEDAGLAEVAVNPLVLSRIVDLLLAPGKIDTKLPRSRAGVLMRTFEHVAGKRGLLDRAKPQAPAELAPAVAVAASLCVMFGHHDQKGGADLRFRLADLSGLLAQSWPAAADPEWAYIPTDMHLARMVIGSVGDEAEFVHQTLIDFAIALLFRDRAPPEFLILDRPDLAQTLGDWVGLHSEPAAAVKAAIDFAMDHYRPDLLVDVGAANDGILSPTSRKALWNAVGLGLAGARNIRDRTADRLAELSPSLARAAIADGLLAAISKDAALVATTHMLLMSRRFTSRAFQRARRQLAWQQSRGGSKVGAAGRFAMLDRDALIVILRTALKQEERGAAATALGALGDRNAAQPLSQALKDDAASVRGSAATALGALGDRSAAQPLSHALKDDAPSVRGAAAMALGALGDGNAAQPLSHALKDDAPSVRGAAAMALGALGDRNAMQPLSRALKDDAPSVRGAAATALGALGDRNAVQPLSYALKDDASSVRGAAATALGALGDRNAVQPLCHALKDDAPNVRGSAAAALGLLGDRNAVQPLSHALKDDAPNVRGSAATSLGVLGDRNAVQPLCHALKDDDLFVRRAAATALGALGDRNAVQPLCHALKDDDPFVRGAAATALGALGDRNAVQPLCHALKDDAPGVRGSAATALGVLGDRNAMQPLSRALKDDAPSVRGAAATALGALGDRNAVQPLCHALKDDAPSVRGSAAAALGVLGDRQVIEQLRALLGDPNDRVRLSAVNGLGQLADQLTSEEIIQPLIDAARHNSAPSVRTSALMTLARHERVDLSLVRYLLDPDFKRADDRRRDTDWGVQGQTAAAVLNAYARSIPSDDALAIITRLLGEFDTQNDVLRAALAPLANLPAPALKRALADLAARLPRPPDRVAKLLGELQYILARRELAEQRAVELASCAAETLRSVFSPAPRPWFEKSKEPLFVSRTAVLLTAAPIEAKSVYQGLNLRGIHLESLSITGHTFEHGTFPGADGGSWQVVLAQPLEKGPHAMHSLVKDVLAQMRPELILMVGMCGGIEENGANENAVIVAKQVLNYEPQRLRPDGPTLKPSSYRCDPRILTCLNALDRRGVLGPATEDGDAPIELLTKDIGSGEKLIDDLNSPVRAKIIGLSGDLVGVEQEGHGLYHPLWEDLLRGAPPAYALVKGVSDLGDGHMRENKSIRQTRATRRALTVALAIIGNFA